MRICQHRLIETRRDTLNCVNVSTLGRWHFFMSAKNVSFIAFHFHLVIVTIQCNRPSFKRQTRHCTIHRRIKMNYSIRCSCLYLSYFSSALHLISLDSIYRIANISTRAYSFIITFFSLCLVCVCVSRQPHRWAHYH